MITLNPLGKDLSVGGGISGMLIRKVNDTNASFGFVPIYGTLSFHQANKLQHVDFSLRAGTTIFIANKAYLGSFYPLP